ncbi:MAG: deoxyribonuclease IV [Candidatus Methylomirabilia bacterium]
MTRRKPAVLIGAHISIAGGTPLAFGRGVEAGCDAMQIFTKNATRWEAPPLAPEEVGRFRSEQARTGIGPVVAHGSYLINLASPDPVLLERSRQTFLEELRRAGALGLPCVITHPGAHMGAGVEAGLARVAESLDWIEGRAGEGAPLVCLENTAGPGTVLAGDFAHLGAIFARVRNSNRLGVCLDTCHAHAAGYDFTTPAAYRASLAALEAAVGPGRVLALHLNDAKGERGGRLDRHEHIGRGRIGLECFRLFMNDGRFTGVPKIIETPKEDGARQMDPINLEVLRRLAGVKRVPPALAREVL